MMGLASLFMVACNNAPKQQEQTAEEPQQEQEVVVEHQCPFCTLKAEYANWDNMDETAKAELNKKAYDLFAEMDAVMEKWANIETMTVEEVKDLVLERIAAMGMGKCEHHEGEEAHQCCEKPAEAAE